MGTGECELSLGLTGDGARRSTGLGLVFQQGGYLLVALFSGYHGWGLALVVGQYWIGAMLEQ